MMKLPTVAIVGRPNVGKSTLFNRLVGGRRAIVEATPGVTRDRNYGPVRWRGRTFSLVDTGGFEPATPTPLSRQVVEQAELAMEHADVIIFLVDAREGLTPLDEEIALRLRQTVRKPILLVTNKMDPPMKTLNVTEFYRLGFSETFAVSAEHGIGVGELLDRLLDLLPATGEDQVVGDAVTIAVLGRPNVGKSSLVNRILGEPRVIVSPDPGTTRDAIDTPFTYQGQQYLLIDTAGIRAKGPKGYPLEYYSVLRAIKSLERCDVALLLLDATDGVVQQDARIAGQALDAGCALILLVNKWDLVEKEPRVSDHYVRQIREKLKHVDYAPVLFVSALAGQRIFKIFTLVERVLKERDFRVPSMEINRFIRQVVEEHPPPTVKGRQVQVRHATHVGVRPPTFQLFVNDPGGIAPSYERYLANRIRTRYGFDGNPIRIRFRAGHPRRRPGVRDPGD